MPPMRRSRRRDRAHQAENHNAGGMCNVKVPGATAWKQASHLCAGGEASFQGLHREMPGVCLTKRVGAGHSEPWGSWSKDLGQKQRRHAKGGLGRWGLAPYLVRDQEEAPPHSLCRFQVGYEQAPGLPGHHPARGTSRVHLGQVVCQPRLC